MSSFHCPFDSSRGLWGFHVHMDTRNDEDCANSLVVQSGLLHFLVKTLNAPVVADETFRPGYGPHKRRSWEIRVEIPLALAQQQHQHEEKEENPFLARAKKILPLYGAAAIWMMANCRGISSGFVHLINHDESLPGFGQLLQEADTHTNACFFSTSTRLGIDFFINPPTTTTTSVVKSNDEDDDDDGQHQQQQHQRIKDTRTPNQMTEKDREALRKQAIDRQHQSSTFVADASDVAGFRIAVHFSGRSEAQRTHALGLFDALLDFLKTNLKRSPDEVFCERSSNVADASFCLTFLAADVTAADDNQDKDNGDGHQNKKRQEGNALLLCECVGYSLAFIQMNGRNNLEEKTFVANNVSILPVARHQSAASERATRQQLVFEGLADFAFVGAPPPLTGRYVKW